MGDDRTPGRSWGLTGGETDPWSREVEVPAAPPPARFRIAPGDVPPGAVPPGAVAPGDVPPGDVPPGAVPPAGERRSDDDLPLPPSRWRRWVAIAAVVGLAAAFGVVLVGGDGGAPGGEPVTTPVANRPTERSSAPEPSSVPTTAAPPSTALEASAPSTTVTDRWPLLGAPPLRLAVLAGTTLSIVDLATGEVAPIREVDPPSSDAPIYLVAARGAYTALSWDAVDGFRLNPDGTYAVIPAEDQAGGPLLAGPTPGTVWEFPVEEDDFARLVDVTGRPVGPMALPRGGAFLGSGGDGRLLLEGPGGVYRIDVEAPPRRVTTGELIAVGPDVAYARECDERFSCEGVRIDLATGERTPAPPDVAGAAPLDGLGGWPDGSTVSPDGDVSLVRRRGIGGGWAFVDVAAGVTVDVRGPRPLSPIVWSPDSAFAVYLGEEGILVYDRARGEVVEVPLADVVAYSPIVDAVSG